MNVPDLKSLQCGDADAWDAAFHWLWPVAFEVVRNKLSPFLPADIEDVAFEALEELIEKVREVNRTEELKPLLASISHHRAVDLLRERFSQKRGEGRTESLDATPEEQADDCEPVAWESPLNSLEQKELVEGLRTTLATLKPPLGDVLEQCRRLAAAGHPEVVLIGTHLGRYGQDLPGAPDLAGLCRLISTEPSVRRVRLSSIEPREVTPELIALAAAGGHARDGEGKLCRHLHIPLQSGCDTVLRRMARPYCTSFYAEPLRALHAAEAGICLGADVMVGFPGETEDEFEQTRAFLAGLPLAYLHVFTYSRRPGTPAAEMPDQVDYETKIARNHVLRDLSEAKRAAFAQANVGRQLEVVVETRHAATPAGRMTGLSDNYLQVQFPGDESLAGTLVTVAITAADEGGVQGDLIG